MSLLHHFIFLFCLLSPLSLTAGSLTDRLSGTFAGADEILDPEQAFRIDYRASAPNRIEIRWSIEPGYYLYDDKFAFTALTDGVQLGAADRPQGKLIEDPLFGEVAIHTEEIVVTIPVTTVEPDRRELNVEVKYQGCKKDSVCYPPISKTLDFILPTASAAQTFTTPINADATTVLSEQDAITQRLQQGNLLLNIAVFFGFGLLLSLTPCVFPMIPILSGVIVGQGDRLTTSAAFFLSLIYVLAMALTYAVLGMFAGLFHFNLQAAAQNPYVLISFSLVFVALALSMFGFYQIQLPAGLQQKLDALSRRQRSGSVLGVAIMGCLSAIIVGPCVAPPLAGALLYISQTGDAVLGGLALFAMGLGFGVPLLVVGTSAGKLLPRAGQWMDTVKAVFGVIMLGVAIWFLERLFAASFTLLLWAALFIVSSVYVGAFDSVQAETSAWRRFWKGLGVVLLFYGIVLIIGAVSGGRNVLQPLPANLLSFGNQTGQLAKLDFIRIKSIDDLNTRLRLAAAQDKQVMLDFYAKWCVDCNEMEQYTFSDAGVQQALADVVLLKADVTDNDPIDQALLKRFNLFGPPAILFFDTNSKERLADRLIGFVPAAEFIRHIDQVKAL